MMPVLTFDELNMLVFAAFIFGLALAFVYHIGEFFLFLTVNSGDKNRKNKPVFVLLRFFADLIFGITATVFSVVLFSSYGKGQMRIIAILSMALGFVLWHATIGRLTPLLALRMKKIILRLFRYVYRKAVYPIIKRILSGIDAGRSRLEIKKAGKYHEKRERELFGVITDFKKTKGKGKNEKHK